MKTWGLMLLCCGALAACGGSPNRVDRLYSPTQSGVLHASGSIKSACMRADRKAASAQLCGCVQAVANKTLSGSDRALAVKFFSDPHHAQEIRQSDNRNHEIFWQKYKAFSRQAERTCR